MVEKPILNNLANLAPHCSNRTDGYKVLVISGPGGVGKGAAIATILREYDPHFFFSVSCTTRQPRIGEQDGVHYKFMEPICFQEVRDHHRNLPTGFLEWNQVHGEWYGTPKAPIFEALGNGKFAILEIDVEGAERVREVMPEACFAFLHAPAETLVERLNARKVVSMEERKSVERRLERLPTELEAAKKVFQPHEWIESVPAPTAEESVQTTAMAIMQHLDAHAGRRWVDQTRAAQY